MDSGWNRIQKIAIIWISTGKMMEIWSWKRYLRLHYADHDDDLNEVDNKSHQMISNRKRRIKWRFISYIFLRWAIGNTKSGKLEGLIDVDCPWWCFESTESTSLIIATLWSCQITTAFHKDRLWGMRGAKNANFRKSNVLIPLAVNCHLTIGAALRGFPKFRRPGRLQNRTFNLLNWYT